MTFVKAIQIYYIQAFWSWQSHHPSGLEPSPHWYVHDLHRTCQSLCLWPALQPLVPNVHLTSRHFIFTSPAPWPSPLPSPDLHHSPPLTITSPCPLTFTSPPLTVTSPACPWRRRPRNLRAARRARYSAGRWSRTGRRRSRGGRAPPSARGGRRRQCGASRQGQGWQRSQRAAGGRWRRRRRGREGRAPPCRCGAGWGGRRGAAGRGVTPSGVNRGAMGTPVIHRHPLANTLIPEDSLNSLNPNQSWTASTPNPPINHLPPIPLLNPFTPNTL